MEHLYVDLCGEPLFIVGYNVAASCARKQTGMTPLFYTKLTIHN